MSIRFKETVATANFNASYGFTDFTTHSETTHFEITADAQNVAMIECKMLVLALVSLRTLSCEVDIADIEILTDPVELIPRLTNDLISDSAGIFDFKASISICTANIWFAAPLLVDEGNMKHWERRTAVNYPPLAQSGWVLLIERSSLYYCHHKGLMEFKLAAEFSSVCCFCCLEGEIFQREILTLLGDSEVEIELRCVPHEDRLMMKFSCSKFQIGKSSSSCV